MLTDVYGDASIAGGLPELPREEGSIVYSFSTEQHTKH
jgi:hypothetical protein